VSHQLARRLIARLLVHGHLVEQRNGIRLEVGVLGSSAPLIRVAPPPQLVVFPSSRAAAKVRRADAPEKQAHLWLSKTIGRDLVLRLVVPPGPPSAHLTGRLMLHADREFVVPLNVYPHVMEEAATVLESKNVHCAIVSGGISQHLR
jgi:hypothetical protein